MSSCRIVESEPEKKFVPFKLEIDINTPDDLMEIFHRVNLNQCSIRNLIFNKESFPCTEPLCKSIFSEIEEKAKPYIYLKAGR
jgi:hypothetical protein